VCVIKVAASSFVEVVLRRQSQGVGSGE